MYIAKGEESLLEISQIQGVRLESLMEYNKLKKDAIVHSGDKIYLRPQLASTGNGSKASKK